MESAATIAYPSFLMCPPFGLSIEQPNNIFMDELLPAQRLLNRDKAIRQFLDLYNFISSTSLVYLLPDIGLQDQTYVANLGIILPHLKEYPIIIANFLPEIRRGETPLGVDFFNLLGFGPVTVAPPHFEGEADCKYLRDNIFFMPHGTRTTLTTNDWFHGEFDMHVIPIRLTNPYAQHLESIIFPLTRHKVIAVPSEMQPHEIQEIEKVAEIIAVPNSMIPFGVTNLLRCRRMLLMGSSIQELQRRDDHYAIEQQKVDLLSNIAANNSLEPIVFNLSEFRKSGGFLSSLFMHINYSDYAPGRSEDG